MLTDMLSMGYNVNLEGFGTFSLSLAFEDEKPREILNPDDNMTYRKVGVKDINFKASPEFIKDVKRETDRDLERDMGGVKVIRKQLYSREERIARVKDINFKASPEFIKDVKRETDRDLERDMGGVKVIRKQLYSREERIARALE